MSTTKLQLAKDVQWAVGTNILALKFIGLWRNENYSRWHETLSNMMAPIYVLIIIFSVILPQSWALVKVWGNMTLVTENLLTLLPYIASMSTIITIWYKKEAIITIMNFIKEDWLKLKSKEEREVMMKYARVWRLITLGGYILISSTVVVFNGPCICFGIVARTVNNITDTGERPLILPTIFFFDVYKRPIYELMLIDQLVSSIIGCLCYQTVIALFVVMVLHVSSQFENLAVRIEDILKNDIGEQNNFQMSLTLKIKEHQRLIRFANMIENTFSVMLLIILPLFTIIICVQGFQLIEAVSGTVKGNTTQLLSYVLFLFFTSAVIFVYTLMGEILIAQSEKIELAAYKCEWYDLRPKEAAQLIVVLIRAQRPLQLTAGKIVPLTLTTFASLVKTTSGYLTCLLAVHE